ncbi:DUF5305 domain-containing protein [Clostridium sp. DL1XJH146]
MKVNINMKKLNINKKIRFSLIGIIVIVVGVFSFLLYKTIDSPGCEEKITSLYSYNNKAEVTYNVSLKENSLYDGESIGQGEFYIAKYIDNINTSMNYEYTGETKADIKGDYEIYAIVEGYTGEEESYETIWQKKYILSPKESFEANDKTITLEKEIPINFNEYNDFTAQLFEDSNISTEAKVTVFWDINVSTNTDKGLVEEKISPKMEIPLNEKYFKITGELVQDKQGNIEKTEQVTLPVNKVQVSIYSVFIVLLLVISAILIFCAKETDKISSLEKNLKSIFKIYGDRLVALNSKADGDIDNYNEVKSIEDLVRIADDIGKPIIYKHSDDFKEITKFYVFDETKTFILYID